MHVLVADDDELSCVLLRELLRTFGHDCVTVTDGTKAWEYMVAHGADVVISDWQMPGLSGVELCQQVRAHPDIASPYFILLTGRGDRVDVLNSLRAGVDEHLAKPLDIAQLEARLIVAQRARAMQLETIQVRQDMAAANRRLDEAAHRDALTSLGNRLRLEEDLPNIHERFVRAGHAYNIALVDIDHFKGYNDSYGHQAGDALLAETGRVLASQLRRGDLVYRYGGDEFLIVLPNRTVEEAGKAAERIRTCVAAATTAAALPAPATMSAGVAGPACGETIESVIERADQALYGAKKAGRDQVLVDVGEMSRNPL